MIIPYQQLSADALDGVIEAFVLQEGTDYGEQEFTLAEKIQQVKQQLQAGEVMLVFSELYQTVNIVPASHFS